MQTKSDKFYIKELLLFIGIFSSYPAILNRFQEIDSFKSVLIYLILYFSLLVVAVTTSYIRNNSIRLSYALIYFFSFVFLDVYSRTTGEFLTYASFISMMKATGFATEAIIQYAEQLFYSCVFGLFVLAGIALPSKKQFRAPQFVFIGMPVISVILLSLLMFSRGGDGGKALPSMFTPLAYNNLYLYEKLNNQQGDRKTVQIQPGQTSDNKDVVFIIDESIRGDFLDINSSYGINSNLQIPKSEHGTKNKPWKISNFGIAASVSTCSSEVNVTLRYGGTRQAYQKIIDTYPSIWAYAIKAGFKTVYIDSQRTGGKLQNEMTPDEKKLINRFIQFDNTPIYQRDILAAKEIAALSNNQVKEFILVNKMGAHFPIHDKYPDNFIIHKPALPRGQFLNISDTGDRQGFDGDNDWPKYWNSYKNTLLWNVGEFFSILEEHADFSNMTLLYTSDHGQNLHLNGSPGVTTHCSGEDAGIEEAVVPLFIMEGKNKSDINWNKSIQSNFNQSSHFNIFPSLLLMMNYKHDEVIKLYGNPLNEKVNDPYTFNTRFNARLGKAPIWKKINLSKLARPPQLLTQQVSN